jgi:CRISPR-associated protein Cas6
VLVQINFSVKGSFLPADHNYALYAALINFNPLLRSLDWQLGTINGVPNKKGLIQLGNKSSWFIRIDHQYINLFSDLAEIRLGAWTIQVAIQSIVKIEIHLTLVSRLVVIKGYQEIEPFYQSLLRKFPLTPIIGDRKTIKIKQFTVVGFSVTYLDLDGTNAQTLLNQGLGGKRRLGCGVFCKVL